MILNMPKMLLGRRELERALAVTGGFCHVMSVIFSVGRKNGG